MTKCAFAQSRPRKSPPNESVLLAFVFRKGHDPIGNRPDIHHDLSDLDELYRIGAFVGVAVILIAASFIYQRFLAPERA